jgi:hypothetical protein
MDGVRGRVRRPLRLWVIPGALALTVAALGAFLSGARAAATGYHGKVKASSKTVTLTGSGNVRLSTGGGVLHHGSLGTGFASAEDFDSTRAGVQTVPDTGQWQVNVSGGGSDTLEVDEGERTSPVSYTSGHTFVPGGTPCMVRDPNNHHGLVQFSVHPKQETEFCYPHGINNVIVRGGPGSVQYGVLDTQPGVPLHLYGSTHRANSIEEVAGVPTEVGGFHNPMSPVYFVGGRKAAEITFNDGITKKPVTYRISRSEIVKSGLPALHYSTQNHRGSELILYPQRGPATIEVGPTGGILLQVFGNFFGQKGPDRIDASHADGPALITGSTGNDTIFASPAGGFVSGGGGNPTIHALNDFPMSIQCAPSGRKGTAYVTTRDTVAHCRTVRRRRPVVVLNDVKFTPARVSYGSKLKLRVPPYAQGQLKLSFQLASCAGGKCSYKSEGTASVRLSGGRTSLTLSPTARVNGHSGRLRRGRYRVDAQLTSGGIRSKTERLSLVIR